jgi:ankyrin repeat protein
MLCYPACRKRNAIGGQMKTNGMRAAIALALATVLTAPGPAAAQGFSDGYAFLKAVRDRDGTKVNDMAGKPGSTVIDSRDPSTGDAALHITAKRRDLTWLSFLLARGARPDIKDNDGNTPLATAATVGFAEGARVLISAGAKVDSANSRGETPLILAVQNRDLLTARLLIDAGANPKISDNVTGMNARDYAARDARSPAMLKLLDSKPAPKPAMMGPKL